VDEKIESMKEPIPEPVTEPTGFDVINNLAKSMAEKIAASGERTIAVVDFVDPQGNVTELGRFLAEEFSAAFVNADKGFEVVDRFHLKSILNEHKLSASGLIDPTTARELGKVAGVGVIVTGTVTPFGERVKISAKALATETAKVICAPRGSIPKTMAIKELLSKGIETEP
ncbi:MAG: CsgG/HfaB family protein, partial [Desulfobacterales bacterium]|nr:CsgG/HfaB family protein [Desulfobacterales bacterium]